MDFKILYAIQGIRTPLLDKIFVVITSIPGNYGQIWALLALILLVFKKTRKCGITMLVSYLLVYGMGQYVLKDLIARPRPCHLDQSIELLISRPSSYSCPSTHSGWAFAAATSIFLFNKKIGILTYVFSTLVAFSRLYLFVHFPTDVLLGIVLGVLFAILTKIVLSSIKKKKKHYDISLMEESMVNYIKGQDGLCFEKFHADIITKDIDYSKLKVGDKLVIDGKKIKIVKVGKQCFKECNHHSKPCLLSKNVAFAKLCKKQ